MAFSRILLLLVVVVVVFNINIILQTMESPSMTLSLTYSKAIPLISLRSLLPL